MKKLLRKMRKNQVGATMVEYGLMLALIAIVCILVVTALGNKTANVFDNAQQHMSPTAPIAATS